MISFLTNQIVDIKYPVIEEDSEERLEYGLKEYQYKNKINYEMGYVDIFDTFLISFFSSEEWEKPNIKLKKISILEDKIKEVEIEIDNISKEEHLNIHSQKIEKKKYELVSLMTENFSKYKDKYLNNKIVVTKEAEENFQKVDKYILKKAITILYDLDKENKIIKDYKCSDESLTVKNNPNLNRERLFKLDDKNSEYVYTHIKNFPSGYRMYFLEKNEKIYICYLGPHLPTKKY